LPGAPDCQQLQPANVKTSAFSFSHFIPVTQVFQLILLRA
jgi:hypothetical protein